MSAALVVRSAGLQPGDGLRRGASWFLWDGALHAADDDVSLAQSASSASLHSCGLSCGEEDDEAPQSAHSIASGLVELNAKMFATCAFVHATRADDVRLRTLDVLADGCAANGALRQRWLLLHPRVASCFAEGAGERMSNDFARVAMVPYMVPCLSPAVFSREFLDERMLVGASLGSIRVVTLHSKFAPAFSLRVAEYQLVLALGEHCVERWLRHTDFARFAQRVMPARDGAWRTARTRWAESEEHRRTRRCVDDRRYLAVRHASYETFLREVLFAAESCDVIEQLVATTPLSPPWRTTPAATCFKAPLAHAAEHLAYAKPFYCNKRASFIKTAPAWAAPATNWALSA
ncbi:hypothetical protein M885DRAFT_523499 [Pelagophyceae sp. CCMP2097]|nr:hypothetical protein M885DRAFT_523499 [Pelagophyceae sp. CCMP2097]